MLGRPSIFSEELATHICTRLADGESLRAICKDEGMPSKSTVLEWVLDGKHKEFTDQYARARELQAESMADELLDIADDGKNDWMERQYGDGSTYTVANTEHIQRSRVRIDTRKWIAAHLLPKKYADMQKVEHSGQVTATLVINNG